MEPIKETENQSQSKKDVKQRHLTDFHDDVGDDIRRIIFAVGGVAQVTIDLAHFEHIDYAFNVRRLLKKMAQGLTLHAFHFVLQCFGMLGMIVRYREMPFLQALDCQFDLDRCIV
jgi:hypothetical protein